MCRKNELYYKNDKNAKKSKIALDIHEEFKYTINAEVELWKQQY